MNTYFRILSYARPFRQHVPLYILCATLAILFGLLNFTLLKPLFDVIFKQADPDELLAYSVYPEFEPSINYLNHLFNYYLIEATEIYGAFGSLVYVCLIIVTSVFLSNLFTYISGVILARVRAKVIKRMRMDIFEKVSTLHIGYFSDERKGDLISKITNDVQEVENSVVQSLKVIFKEPATVILYFAVLFAMSFKLTIFTLVLIPISGGIIGYITKKLKRRALQSQESLGRIVNILDETISGMRVIKAFNARKYIVGKFDKETDFYSKVNISMAKKNEAAGPISQFFGVSVVAGILVFGGSLVLANESPLSPSAFLSYIIIFTQILIPTKEISRALSSIQRGLASARRIFAVVDTETKIQNDPKAIQISGFDKSITFNSVSFSYEQDVVLSDINLTLEKGKTIALVGPSGGGKSTLADLVPRFYDPTVGSILIDGIDLKQIDIDSLRKQMGIVTQESILFNDTIFNNIAFGMTDVSQEQVEHAAKIANAHEFILKLENGYETNIGERGTKLSGGQRQRISIARAVLKNPPILILDEATSALDTESERLVQEALTNLMQNRTSLVIAHRLSTIQHADEIVVIEKGRIIEKGTHEALLANKGLYHKLSNMQSFQ
ncbi:ABC transporter ATP-binding protein [Penaeicola halotolerans]|uniref:ABC transporter ATP-binding protein n=1 Tax=Penaeicola halotolerans TaxID=2793196 RepID=UPI001CF8968B|nr:ABC transporter transmembrane domain-containing protein [Penaeicola halotolerans]